MAGVAVWAAFVAARVPDMRHEAWAHALLLFAVLVLVPLAWPLWTDGGERGRPARLLGWVWRTQPIAALALTAACWIGPGAIALVLALPWVACTALLAAAGVGRIAHEGWGRQLDALCADIALIYAAVGGLWLMADRAGFQPLGFASTIVTLTAVHFHYAGMLLPLMAGLAQREFPFSRAVSRIVVGVVLGVPAVAIGITVSQLGGGLGVETAAACALALAGMAVGVLHVRLATEPRLGPARARVLLGASGVSLFFAMTLACVYAIRPLALPFPWLDLPAMRLLHGTLNALGFGLCGVLGWRGVRRG
jgi:hypothetical protein